MLKQLKRQYHNIFKIKAVSLRPLIFNAVLFPFRSQFNWNTKPINIVWDITYRCNLDCQYCMFAKSKLHTLEKELPTEEITQFIKKVKKYNPSFFLTGGEPLLRTDLEEIISAIRSHKMKVGLNTNATLLTKDRLLKLNEAGLNYMIISLDTSREATDSVRGMNVHKKVLEAIEAARKMNLKIKLVINCVVSETNYQHLDSFLDFIENLKIDALKLSYLHFNTKEEADNHRQECYKRLGEELVPDHHKKELSRSGEEIADKIKTLLPKIKKMKTPVSFNPNLSKEEIINWFNNSKYLNRKCLYTFNVMRISPNGDIYPCHLITKPAGNILKDDIIKTYNNKFYKLLRKELKKSFFPACVRCNKL